MTPTCPNCEERPLDLDGEGIPVYECHACEMAWPVSFFGDDLIVQESQA